MRRHLTPIALTVALLSLAACASTTVEARAPVLDTSLQSETCPTCGRPAELVPFEWDQTIPGSEPPPIIYIPGGDFMPFVPPPVALPADEALLKARVDGTYRTLLRKIEVPDDYLYYGAYYDYGRWEGTAYAGYDDLPPGDWVYVYPHWYVWESTARHALPTR